MSDRTHSTGDAIRLDVQDYKTIFDNVSDAIIVHPPDSADIIEVNTRATELFGYDREELLTRTISDLTADDWSPPNDPSDNIRRAREEGNIKFEWRDQRKDGTRFWVEVNLSLVELQGGERVISSIRDISTRKEQERRRRAIFDQTYQFTGLLEPDGTLIEANQTALDFGDLEREDVVGKPLWECYWCLISEETQETVKQGIERAATGEFVRTELKIQGSQTAEIIDFSLRPVTDDSGTVDLIIPEGRLITEQYERGQRLDVIDRILRHNLRNQLTVIEAFANRIADRIADPEIERLASDICDAGNELESLSSQIREFERLKRGETTFEPVDIQEVVESIITEYNREHPEVLFQTAFEHNAMSEPVWSNEAFLRLALSNLVENAVEHGESPICLTVEQAPEKANSVMVTVIDEGDGLSESEHRPLMRGSEQALSHGSGIGLWIVKWSVEELGGELTFDNSDGQMSAIITLRTKRKQV